MGASWALPVSTARIVLISNTFAVNSASGLGYGVASRCRLAQNAVRCAETEMAVQVFGCWLMVWIASVVQQLKLKLGVSMFSIKKRS